MHSGKTSTQKGRPRFDNLAVWTNHPGYRRRIEGDFKTGCGGKHPFGPEHIFNAKLPAGLRFGMANLDGSNLDVCDAQIDPHTYFNAEGFFQVPNMNRPCFWVCPCPDLLTPFDMPLSRPLQGTVKVTNSTTPAKVSSCPNPNPFSSFRTHRRKRHTLENGSSRM